MGSPNLCGYYYKMTDLAASQLFHLTDIVKVNCHSTGAEAEN